MESKQTIILGVSAFYHDSAATLLIDGEIIAAAQEERFTRKKNDASFPINAIQFVLDFAHITISDIDILAFYDKPFFKFERLLDTYHVFAPHGLRSFIKAMPVWIKEKLFLKREIKKACQSLGDFNATLLFPEHHLSHAASAFYPSPFDDAAILTIDGVGEWATTTIAHGSGNSIKMCAEINFPHSLGLLYSAFTYYCGFKVNSGEYKLMGLAPYGNPHSEETTHFISLIKKELIDIRDDGSFLLNMKFFNFPTGLTMTNDSKWTKLFQLKRRQPESELTQSYMNLALAIQIVTEEIIIKLAKTAAKLTHSNHLVLAGGGCAKLRCQWKVIKK